MQEVAIHTLKNSLSAVLEKVQAGEDAIITSHRKPIAKIVALSIGVVKPSGDPTTASAAGKPTVPGITWRSGRFVPKEVTPVAVHGKGLTVADMLIAQRSGESVSRAV